MKKVFIVLMASLFLVSAVSGQSDILLLVASPSPKDSSSTIVEIAKTQKAQTIETIGLIFLATASIPVVSFWPIIFYTSIISVPADILVSDIRYRNMKDYTGSQKWKIYGMRAYRLAQVIALARGVKATFYGKDYPIPMDARVATALLGLELVYRF